MRYSGARLAALVTMPGLAWAAVAVDALWGYGRPELSEQRFRAAWHGATGDDLLVLRTQIARALSLRQRFEEAHLELDARQPFLEGAGIEAVVRAGLERGRTWRSSGQPERGRPLFLRALEQADEAGLRALAADALHMVALVAVGLENQRAINHQVVDYARASSQPPERRSVVRLALRGFEARHQALIRR